MFKRILCLLYVFLAFNTAKAQTGTFTNPLLPAGADPWIIYKDGYYYYTNSLGDRLAIWKTKDITQLKAAERNTIWIPPQGTAYSHDLWAPEMHFINGKWYMYFAADNGKNQTHRIYVLENASADPMQGNWQFKGELTDASDKWAIDASVFRHKGKLYLIWSGWEGNQNGEQNIYIANLKNPYTVAGKRVLLSKPRFSWEKHGDLHDANNPPHVNVNEGPEILEHGNKIFLIYSASGCWTDYYALGMLVASANSNLLDPLSWKKLPLPVFKQSPENGVYAPGHNSFFKSPDGKEDWILYHANPKPGCGCDGQRSPRMQKFTWDKNGFPIFGIPAKTDVPLPVPSGK